MAKTAYPEAKNPLILRFHRLMDAFAKSDDERDFYLDRIEGFLLFIDQDKSQEELDTLEKEFEKHGGRYLLIPKMTFYESKKFMEGFVNEKVYDIDTKEKLLDIIQSKEARENFLEFIYDHLTELEKWQQFYVERSRIRIIEWLRRYQIKFVFEEDLDLTKNLIEKLKKHLFDSKVPREVSAAREAILAKSIVYYSNEALNPRPKRGRPPKQVVKVELEPQVTVDIYTTVPSSVRQFLYSPEITSATEVTFSSRYDTEAELLASLRGSARVKVDEKLQALSERLESLRHISSRLADLKEMGPEGEGKFIRGAVTFGKEEVKEEVEEKGKKGIMEVVKAFLPKKREKAKPVSKEIEAEIKVRPTKIVTPIKRKKGGKKS
ncbi:MAG: hypothetical protein K1000chlam3_00549 [Chlamydiae bacterium]|nr:hypothetical protein [Chlamydiota bacterium]